MTGGMTRRDFDRTLGAAAAGLALGGCTMNDATTPRSRIVILGGGFGGLTAARELRAALGPEHAITLVDRKPDYQMGLRKVWILAGLCGPRDGRRPRSELRRFGIDYRQETVTAIDTTSRVVRTSGGELRYDHLLVALGAEPRPDLVPGFSPDAHSLYDVDDCIRLAPKVAALARGRVAIGILAAPYPCPPAPYETAMTLDEVFRRRGVRGQVEIATWTVQPMSLPLMGKAVCDDFERRLAAKGIGFTPKRKTLRLEGSKSFFDGGELAADLLIVVPPHRPPAVVKESGLAGAGDWIPVDRATFRTAVDRVWAVGDCTEVLLDNKMPMPKAGVMAEGQARVAVAGILADLLGRAPAAFEGKGHCFVEHGGGEASKAAFDLFAPGGPRVEMAAPSADAYREKVEFERSRLERWFS